jgi:drug/metabolite transporter (DMT)-like permease
VSRLLPDSAYLGHFLAWILFDERLGGLALFGIAVTAAGLALMIWVAKRR